MTPATRSLPGCSAPSLGRPAALWSSTPASTFGASRSLVPLPMPTAASWLPISMSWQWAGSCFTRPTTGYWTTTRSLPTWPNSNSTEPIPEADMSLAPINWRPDRKTLAEFSEAWMFFLGLVHPMLLKSVFLGLTLATWPIGWAVSSLTLALLYYVIFTPIGLTFKLIGRDAMKRHLDRAAPTYWEPYTPDHNPEAYLQQF